MILFVFPTMASYKREMDHEGAYVSALISQSYIEEILQSTKDIYYSTPEEIRHEQFTDEYRSTVAVLIDQKFMEARSYLEECRLQTKMVNAFLCFFDEENERTVFVVDGNDADMAFLPGQWISKENGTMDNLKTIKRTAASRWYMPVGYGAGWGWTATDYIEIKNDKGEVIGYLTIVAAINDFALQVGWILAINLPFIAVLILIFSYLALSYLYKRVIRPINRLAGAAKEYAEVNKNEESSEGPVFPKLQINTDDEIEQLWETMVDMEEDISSAMKRIVEVTAKEERMAAELDFARNIQLSALPARFPAFPDRDEFDIYANMTPAKEVGGDFYDFFMTDEDHLGMVIADVSGKGVPAALFMMTCKSIIKGTTLRGGSPSEIMRYVNDRLCEDNIEDMFVTVWLGILQISTGEVVACSAGHEYPYVTDEDGNYQMLKDPHGVACGAMEGMCYEDYSFTIPKGGKLFVYTDGVAEAQSKTEEMFGLNRIKKCLNRYKDEAPNELINHMKEELAQFSEGTEQFDDITMLNIWLK